MRVNKDNIRTVEEEYEYWYYKLQNKFDEKLPWDMHPNEIRALDMYYKKLKRKVKESLDLMKAEEHNN